MGKLGEAVVEVRPDLRPLDAGLGQAERRVSGFVGGARSLLAGLGVAAAAVGVGGAGASLFEAARKAADLGESLSKTRTTFGRDAGLIEGLADDLAKKFGLVKRETVDAATAIGLIGQASGLASDESARLGVEMAKLAADIGSFHNVRMEDALLAIRSGLVGESEPLRRFGVLLSEDAVKAEALRLGLVKSTDALSEQAKVRARVSLIRNSAALKPVQGDLERTASSAANQMRKFEGDIENFKTEFGKGLIDPLTQGMSLARELGTTLEKVFKIKPGQDLSAWVGALRLVTASFDPEKRQAVREKGATAVLGDGTDAPKKFDAQGTAWSSDPEEFKKQIRERREAAEKAQADAEARRRAGLSAWERGREDQAGEVIRDWLAYDAGQKTSVNSAYTFGQYREARERSGLSPEAYDEARKKTGLAPEAYDFQQTRLREKRGREDVRRLDDAGAARGVVQLARLFGEKAVGAIESGPGLMSRDRGTAMAAQARIGNAAGPLGPLSGPMAKLLSAAGQGVGAASRGVEAGKEQRSRMGGGSQVMAADDYARSIQTGVFDAEREKQLAELERANGQLADVKEVLGQILAKTGTGSAVARMFSGGRG